MTQSETSLFEAMNTQRAIRHFTTEPVSDDDITTILQSAIHAPNGGNQQLWHFLVIRDREAKRYLGQWYLEAWKTAVSEEMRTLQQYRSGADLGNDMPDTPVVILVCVEHQTRARELGSTTTQGSSIYPAVQNLMLAARGLGLGTVLTTLHTVEGSEGVLWNPRRRGHSGDDSDRLSRPGRALRSSPSQAPGRGFLLREVGTEEELGCTS